MILGSSTEDCNPLFIRVDIKEKMSLGEVLENVCKAEAEANEHDVPFDELLRALRTASPEDNAIDKFQVCLFNSSDTNTATVNALPCKWRFFIEHIPNAKRMLPLRLRILFNTLEYARERMAIALEQAQSIIQQMCTAPTTEVGRTSLLTDASMVKLANPETPLDETWEGAIYAKLEAGAAAHPDRPLIYQLDKTWSYKEVNDLSNQVANFLVNNGIEKEERVAMYAHRSAAIVVGIMGILKSGATFTVIDPAYPVERQIIYLKVSQPRGILTLAAAGGLNEEVQKYIDTELDVRCQLDGVSMEASGALAECSTDSAGVEVGPDNIGTLSFTSGSTGLPKAVRGRHVSLTHFYPWMAQEFGIGEDDRFSMLSGIAHDPIQRDVFTPIFMGASIHIPEAEDIGNPGALAQWVQRVGVSVVHLTPAMGQLLTANATTEMPSLKVALFVGDVLTKRDIKRLQRLADNVVSVNMYGTTETQRAVSFLKIPNDSSIDMMKEILPSGRGMKDVQLLCLNTHCERIGVGELGEIFVRSPHMSAGYLGLPEVTAAKFLVNPFSGVATDRMYRSGDLGRYNHEGIVECIGRADDQVKIRGFRIELGEIDTHLGQHEHVRENRTLVLRDSKEEKQIISFFVPKVEDYSISEIRKHLQAKLPSYAVPTIICPIEKMPLTPNGKIDNRRLPFPDAAIIMAQTSSKASTESNTEATPMEKKLLQVFEEVLGRPVTVDDHFFEVGGHSILATKLTFQLRVAFKQELPLNLLYQYPTVATLAKVIQAGLNDALHEMSSDARESADFVDPALEIKLDESITGAGRTYKGQGDTKGVFLTGATGFLGAFLLADLLDKYPDALVRCLVRAANESAGFERLQNNMTNHQVWKPAYAPRIVAVTGDLSAEYFGLSKDAFLTMAEQTDVIIHNGAMVHWVYPYSKLKPMNVGGTVECLRLATMGKDLASMHFVSSTSVFDSPHYDNSMVKVSEDDQLDGGPGLTVGYGQSKWIAEKLVMLAMTRGVPATIFRPGYITGHSMTGVMNTDDFLVRLMKGCLELGQAPTIRNAINACPVNFVSASIVHIASKPDALGQSYHIDNPHTFRLGDFFDNLLNFGYNLELVDYIAWRGALTQLTLEAKSNALYPLLHFVLDDLPTASKSPALSSDKFNKALIGSGIICPALSDLMGVYISFLVATDYFEAAPRAGEDGVQALPNLAGDVVAVHRSERKL